MSEENKSELIELTAEIASSYLSNNKVDLEAMPSVIRSIYAALSGAGAPAPSAAAPQTPAVSIRKSVGDDFIICLEDGRRFKSLKRHLRTKYGLSPEEYRAKWGLPKTYPMVAPSYAAARSALAKVMGLGQGSHRRAKR